MAGNLIHDPPDWNDYQRDYLGKTKVTMSADPEPTEADYKHVIVLGPGLDVEYSKAAAQITHGGVLLVRTADATVAYAPAAWSSMSATQINEGE